MANYSHALYAALIRYLNNEPGENPDDIKVLKVAPTGKAAFNMNQWSEYTDNFRNVKQPF